MNKESINFFEKLENNNSLYHFISQYQLLLTKIDLYKDLSNDYVNKPSIFDENDFEFKQIF
jgi:hypothetical protein